MLVPFISTIHKGVIHLSSELNNLLSRRILRSILLNTWKDANLKVNGYLVHLQFRIYTFFPSYGFGNILVVGPLLVLLLSALAPGTRVLGEVECEHLTDEAVCVGA